MARAYKCPLKEAKKCTSCSKLVYTKGDKPKATPCKKGTPGCKRDAWDAIEKRAASVPMDSTAGTAWRAGDDFGTQGLGSCSLVVVYDQDYIVGSHIPPARAQRDANGNNVLVATGQEVIADHMRRLDAHLPRIRGTKVCIILTATNMPPDNLAFLRQQLAAKGMRCGEITYDPTRVPRGGVWALSRREGTGWPAKSHGVF